MLQIQLDLLVHCSASSMSEVAVCFGAYVVVAVAAAAEASVVVTYWSWNLASTCYRRQQVRTQSQCCLASSSEMME
jgi:hypothetical protein